MVEGRGVGVGVRVSLRRLSLSASGALGDESAAGAAATPTDERANSKRERPMECDATLGRKAATRPGDFLAAGTGAAGGWSAARDWSLGSAAEAARTACCSAASTELEEEEEEDAPADRSMTLVMADCLSPSSPLLVVVRRVLLV